jgi:uncharacterized Rossmann fold enzyme
VNRLDLTASQFCRQFAISAHNDNWAVPFGIEVLNQHDQRALGTAEERSPRDVHNRGGFS